MSYRTPLSKAKGLGAAKEGVEHWWRQRLTAIALVPLILWTLFSIALLGTGNFTSVYTWVAHPVTAVLLSVTFIALYYHSALGIQVIVEDYIHVKWLQITALIGIKFINFLRAVIAVFSILKIAFSS